MIVKNFVRLGNQQGSPEQGNLQRLSERSRGKPPEEGCKTMGFEDIV